MERLDIFELQSDLGYYSWNPVPLAKTQKYFCEVTVDELLAGFSSKPEEESPDPLVDLRRIRCPVSFITNLAPQKVPNIFPYDQGYAAALYVATARFGVKLEEIDFVLGGSSLNILAIKEIEKKDDLKYVVQRCGGPILICKSSKYTQNYADVGFQFERLVTGKDMAGKHDLQKVEHLRVMKVGGFNVLFCAEVDAQDVEGQPVEIKAANPRYYGLKVMFQMLSSGAQTLVQAEKRTKGKGKGATATLDGIQVRTMDQMINDHSDAALKKASENILEALTQIKHQYAPLQAKEPFVSAPFELAFDRSGGMSLRELADRESMVPKAEVMMGLLVQSSAP